MCPKTLHLLTIDGEEIEPNYLDGLLVLEVEGNYTFYFTFDNWEDNPASLTFPLNVDLCEQTVFIEMYTTFPIISDYKVSLPLLDDTMSIRYDLPGLCEKILVLSY
jgi:hypothetical protein